MMRRYIKKIFCKSKPDKGYSWIVAIACCYSEGILFGLLKCSGVLYLATANFYSVSREEAVLPYSLCDSLLNLVAPITGILGFRYGMRKVLLFGSVLATAGVSLCYFGYNILWVTIFYGVVFAFGFGFVYSLLPVIVDQYFVEYRSTAMGIVFSGDSVVSIILPSLMDYFMDTYGFRGSFLILGCLVMNIFICGTLMRKPQWLKGQTTQTVKKSNVSFVKEEGTTGGKVQVLFRGSLSQVTQPDECGTVKRCHSNGNDNGCPNLSHVSIPDEHGTVKQRHSDSNDDGCPTLSQIKILDERGTVEQRHSDGNNDGCPTLSQANIPDENGKVEQCHSNGNEQDCPTLSQINKPDERGIVDQCRPNSNGHRCSIVHVLSQQQSYENSALNSASLANIANKTNYGTSEVQTEPKIEDLTLLKAIRLSGGIIINPIFLILALSTAVYYFTLLTYCTIIIDHGIDLGVPEATSHTFVIAVSSGSLFGKIFLGWVTDKQILSRKNFLVLCTLSIAVVLVCHPFGKTFTELLIMAAVYGVIEGAAVSLFPLLLSQYLGHRKQVISFGLLRFSITFLPFIRPTLIGEFRDKTGSYNGVFYVLAALTLFSGLVWLLEPICLKKTKK